MTLTAYQARGGDVVPEDDGLGLSDHFVRVLLQQRSQLLDLLLGQRDVIAGQFPK